MSGRGLELQLTEVLSNLNAEGGYQVSLVCTDQGLLIASSGDQVSSEELAGVTSLFDDIVRRGERDLGIRRVDEVAVLDPGRGRLIVRPLALDAEPRFFLVVRAPTAASWRRSTGFACRQIANLLAPLAGLEGA